MYLTVSILITLVLCHKEADSLTVLKEKENGVLDILLDSIIERYFNENVCVCVITEDSTDILQDFSIRLSVIHIHIGQKSNIEVLEETDALDVRQLPEDTKTFEKLLIEAMNEGCDPFIVKVRNPKSVIHSFGRTTRHSVTRYSKHYIFIPVSLQEPIITEELLPLKEFDYMPDTLFIRYSEENTLTVNNETFINIVTHKFTGNDPSTEIVLDTWIFSNENSFYLQNNNLFPNKVANMGGKLVRCSTFAYVPFSILEEEKDPPLYGGSELSIFLELGKKINFTWENVMDDNYWGTVWPNGSGNGVIGFVHEDITDIGMAGAYSWFSTYQYTDYSHFITSSVITCITPKPNLMPRWMTLYLPLTLLLWEAVLASIVFVSVASFILNAASKKLLGTSSPESFNSLTNSFLTMVGMFMQQPPPESKNAGSKSMKPFIASLLIFFLLISTVYSGGLSAVLTIPRSEPPIDTPAELAASGLPWVQVHEAWSWSLMDSEDEVSKTLVRNFRVHTEEQMTEEATQGKTAFAFEKLGSGQYSIPDYITEEAVQTLRVMKDKLYGSHIVMLTRKSSPFLEPLNRVIESLYETGVIAYWEGNALRQFLSERLQIAIMQSVVLSQGDGPTKLLNDHLQGAYILLCLGLALATVAFVAELAMDRLKMKTEKAKMKRHNRVPKIKRFN